MLNLILFTFTLCVFAAGFWCGKTFLTVGTMATRVKTRLREWLQ